jgi:transcription termination factor Rho
MTSYSKNSREPVTWSSILTENFDKRIFPSIDINGSGTRKEELLVEKDVLNKMWILRKVLTPLSTVESMEFLLGKLMGTKANKDFLEMMNK